MTELVPMKNKELLARAGLEAARQQAKSERVRLAISRREQAIEAKEWKLQASQGAVVLFVRRIDLALERLLLASERSSLARAEAASAPDAALIKVIDQERRRLAWEEWLAHQRRLSEIRAANHVHYHHHRRRW